MYTEEDQIFFDRIKNHPKLKKRFFEIIDIAENTSGEIITADEAEGRAIEEVRKLGKEIIEEWAENRHKNELEVFQENNKGQEHIKKTLLANDIWKNRNPRNCDEIRRKNSTAFFYISESKV